MQNIIDIRPLKRRLRKEYKEIRSNMPAEKKQRLDQKITNKVLESWSFREHDTILIYVSTPIEVSTFDIITEALNRGKTLAVPRCIDGTRDMDFYVIDSFSCLEKGTFGVLEPNPDRCQKLSPAKYGLCIVPALAFDKRGYRLGYGKGYYDRFLSKFKGETLGLCYNETISHKPLPYGRFDKRVSLIITESSIFPTK